MSFIRFSTTHKKTQVYSTFITIITLVSDTPSGIRRMVVSDFLFFFLFWIINVHGTRLIYLLIRSRDLSLQIFYVVIYSSY